MSERKAFNFFKSYYDVFKELPKKDRLPFIEALLDKQFTGVDPGELDGMARFAYISQKHNIDAQVKGFEDKTGVRLTPTDTPTIGGLDTPNQQVIDKGKEKGKVIVIEKGQKAEKFSFKDELFKYGFDNDLISDWMQVRKTKKATNTKTSLKGFLNEIEKRECNLNEVLQIIVEKNWSGFKWQWLDNEKNNSNGKGQQQSKYGISEELRNTEAWRNL